MSNNYFSGSPKIQGGALFASFNSKEGCLFFRLIKQTGWDPKIKKPSFQGGPSLKVKFSQDEVADFIRVVRSKGQSKFYHSFGEDTTTGQFSYYKIEAQGEKAVREGFGLSVKKGDLEIKVGFTLGSAERFSLFLQNALVHIFDFEHVTEMKQAEEYLKNKGKEKPKNGKTAAKEEYLPSEEEKPTESENEEGTESKDSDVDF